jgi:hypothetical protein
VVTQRQQLLEDAIIEKSGDLFRAVRVEVRSTDVTNEQGITSEHGNGAVAEALVGEHERKALERMARCLQNADLGIAEGKAVAFPDVLPVGERQILPVKDPGAGPARKLP